jgi:hypothetical protein
MNQNNESREELRKRLRLKIKNKAVNRTNGISRNKANDMNDKFKKIQDVMKQNNITSAEDLTPEILNKFVGLIDEDTIKQMLQKLEGNPEFKELLEKIQNNIKKE